VQPLDPSMPSLDREAFREPEFSLGQAQPDHAPRFLLLYGSLRERSYSRLLVQEGARLLQAMGAEVRLFDPTGLPLPDGAPATHGVVVARAPRGHERPP
jgi:arsenic resistance protein ArsH